MREYNQALKEIRKPNPDVEKVLNLLGDAAKSGDHRALYALATWYLHGTHVRRSFKRAVKFLHEAIRLGSRDAMYDLAVCYEKGEGVEKSLSRSFIYYASAAMKGEPQSHYEIGRLLFYGIGVPKNRDLAKHWFKKAKNVGALAEPNKPPPKRFAKRNEVGAD